jgi:hypothetical protein
VEYGEFKRELTVLDLKKNLYDSFGIKLLNEVNSSESKFED